MAEVGAIPRALYLGTNKKSQTSSKERIIISDLAGKRHVQYKTYQRLLGLLTAFSNTHSYNKRFIKFLKANWARMSAGQKKSFRSLNLKIIHSLDDQEVVRRADVLQNLLGEGYREKEIQDAITKLHRAGLVRSGQGPAATLVIK